MVALTSVRSCALALTLVTIVACGDESSTTGSTETTNGNGGETNTTSSNDGGNGTTTASSSDGGNAQGGASTTGQGGGTGGGTCVDPSTTSGPVDDCAAIGASECFSNYDCDDGCDRCANAGTENLPTACCVYGERGKGQLGDKCNGESDCASSLCVETDNDKVCTDKCANKDACIPSMPNCSTIAFSGSNDKFCIP